MAPSTHVRFVRAQPGLIGGRGILAQRGKNRPNRLGLGTVSVLRREGSVLFVQGLDAVDGPPVLDIKPVMQEFLPRGEIRQPEWVAELMKEYWNDKG